MYVWCESTQSGGRCRLDDRYFFVSNFETYNLWATMSWTRKTPKSNWQRIGTRTIRPTKLNARRIFFEKQQKGYAPGGEGGFEPNRKTQTECLVGPESFLVFFFCYWPETRPTNCQSRKNSRNNLSGRLPNSLLVVINRPFYFVWIIELIEICVFPVFSREPWFWSKGLKNTRSSLQGGRTILP